MGGVASVLEVTAPRTYDAVVREVLRYLRTDDYSFNPSKYYSNILWYGYPSLENFIAAISPNRVVGCIETLNAQHQVKVKNGMRFVSKSDPFTRGSVVGTVLLDSYNSRALIVKLLLDRNKYSNCFCRRCLSLISYLLRFLLPRSWTSRGVEEFYLHELELEKVYLRRFLRSPETLETDDEDELISNLRAVNQKSTSRFTSIVDGNPSFSHLLQPTMAPNVQNHVTKRRKKKGKSKVQIPEKLIQVTRKSPLGPHRGIEGAYNSCYMDAFFFSLFYTTKIFDSILQVNPVDSEYARKTRQLLTTNIVTPLRQDYYCASESVMTFREHLSELNGDVMGSMMDPEELLYLLLQDALKEPEFIQYSKNGDWGDFMHLMSIDNDDPSEVITVQANFEVSLRLNDDLKAVRVPSPALVLGLPRSERKLVNYKAVVPNLSLNITNFLFSAECTSCGGEAHWEAHPENGKDGGVPMCDECALLRHSQNEGKGNSEIVSRREMKLLAILCIRGAHFIAFVRDEQYGWLFFDSMAGGFPEVKQVDNLEQWLTHLAKHPEQFENDDIPLIVQRSFYDGHICIYEPVCLK